MLFIVVIIVINKYNKYIFEFDIVSQSITLGFKSHLQVYLI